MHDHQLSHADGTALAEDIRVRPHPERQIFTYHHMYPHDRGLQRVIEVTATGGAEDTWQEIERTGRLLYMNAQGHVFAQLEHGTIYEDMWLTVGIPKGERLNDVDALVQMKYTPGQQTQLLLQANPPDFDEIETRDSWEEYIPMLRYFLQDEDFIKQAESVTEDPYREEYKRVLEGVGLDRNRFLDGLMLTEVERNAHNLMDLAMYELFPADAKQQLQGWEILQQFGMLADFSTDILQEVLRVYHHEESIVPMRAVLNHIKESEILQTVLDKTTKRIAQFRRASSLYTVLCTLSEDRFHALLQQRKFGKNTVEVVGEGKGPYGEAFPMPDGHEITIDSKNGLVHVVCDTTKYEKRFRNWEVTVPYALPIEEIGPMVLSRHMPFQHIRNIAPVVFLKQ